MHKREYERESYVNKGARESTNGSERERVKKKRETDEEREGGSGEVEKMIFNISNRLRLITRTARTGTCSSAHGHSRVCI